MTSRRVSELSEREAEIIRLVREQDRDDRTRKIKYDPSPDQRVRVGHDREGMTLGDMRAASGPDVPDIVERRLALRARAERLGVDLPYLTGKRPERGKRRSFVMGDDGRWACPAHGPDYISSYTEFVAGHEYLHLKCKPCHARRCYDVNKRNRIRRTRDREADRFMARTLTWLEEGDSEEQES